MEIYLATSNSKKIDEFHSLSVSLGNRYRLRPYSQSGHEFIELPEIQGTLSEIVCHKAKTYGEFANVPVLVDDTSLYIDDLLGPGPYIKQMYFDHGLSKIIERAHGSRATFSVGLAVYIPDRGIFSELASIDGHIVDTFASHMTDRTRGFGFNRIFVPDGWDCTYADLPEHNRLEISPRGEALKRLIAQLEA